MTLPRDDPNALHRQAPRNRDSTTCGLREGAISLAWQMRALDFPLDDPRACETCSELSRRAQLAETRRDEAEQRELERRREDVDFDPPPWGYRG